MRTDHCAGADFEIKRYPPKAKMQHAGLHPRVTKKTIIGTVAMYIDMRWEDENGKELAAVISPPRSMFISLVPGKAVRDFQCLPRLLPFGDVSFPALQIPQLIQDLERLMPHCDTDETRRHVGAMLEVARKACGDVHSCIRFSGD